MHVGHRFWPTVLMCALLSLPAHAGDWVISQAGGSVIEIPGFFGDGVTRTVMIENEHAGVAYEPNGTISLRQYRLRTSNRPFAYLGLKFGFGRIQYSVDEMSRGMVSGDDRHGSGFYAACRREPGALACFELHYDSDYQSDYADIISRVARSFAKNIRP